MMPTTMIKGYYFITDASLSRKGNISDVKDAIDAGVRIVQYRAKGLSVEEMKKEASELRDICRGKAIFIINDYVEVCLAVDGDGVHLGKHDTPYKIARDFLGRDKIIGMSVDNIEEAMVAKGLGADYIAIGPIFPTATKIDAGVPCGVSVIKEIKKRCNIPIVAIGGINLSNAKEVIEAGADAICAISAVLIAHNVKEEIEKFQELFRHFQMRVLDK